MQKTNRVTPVIAIDNVTANVVRVQSRAAASRKGDSFPEQIDKLPALMERVSHAARQMRYFGLATKRFSFDELISSARRAEFVQVIENLGLREATFRWRAG